VIKVKVNGNKEFSIVPKSNGEGELNGAHYVCSETEVKPGTYHVLYKNGSYTIDVLRHDAESKTMQVMVNGTRYTLELRDKYDELLQSLGMSAGTKTIREMRAPMPGMVIQIMVNAGDTVSKDQPLLILEAMKMENVLKAPGDAVIKSINISKGNAVEKNQVLISFE